MHGLRRHQVRGWPAAPTWRAGSGGARPVVRESGPVATNLLLAGVFNVPHGDGRTVGCEQPHFEVFLTVDRSYPNRHIRSPPTTGPRSSVRSAPAGIRHASEPAWPPPSNTEDPTPDQPKGVVGRQSVEEAPQLDDATEDTSHLSNNPRAEETHPHREPGHLPLRPTRDNSAGVDQLSIVLSGTRQLRDTAVGLPFGHLRTSSPAHLGHRYPGDGRGRARLARPLTTVTA